MVRYPEAERRSLQQFEEIRVSTPAGDEIPLPELADREVRRTRNNILRLDQSRAITISAGIDDRTANVQDVVGDLTTNFFPALFDQHPGIRVRWEGDQEETMASLRSLFIGFAIAMCGIFLLLTVQFRSYLQPLLVLAVIPFGMVGAIWGHLAMGLPLTIFTMFGLVALSGVVVNDSIVLIDFINRRRAEGDDLHEALMAAGCQRFRPVLLTSVTTVAGLLPILVERSMQAEILIPMAVSIACGLSLATVWVLLLIPSLYRFYALHLESRKRNEQEYEFDRLSPSQRESERPTEPTVARVLERA
jgi:HAE1 family hydrophobic/amphiphilic exporter-1